MIQNQNISDKDKIKLVKDVYNKALEDISKIEKERDKKIKELLKTIDAKHIAKALEDIKGLK